jgi:hypothetical protein
MAAPAELAKKQQRFAVGDDFDVIADRERFGGLERSAHRLGRIECAQVERLHGISSPGLIHGRAPELLAALSAAALAGVKTTSQSPPPISRSL